jgi:hypothetical protein
MPHLKTIEWSGTARLNLATILPERSWRAASAAPARAPGEQERSPGAVDFSAGDLEHERLEAGGCDGPGDLCERLGRPIGIGERRESFTEERRGGVTLLRHERGPTEWSWKVRPPPDRTSADPQDNGRRESEGGDGTGSTRGQGTLLGRKEPQVVNETYQPGEDESQRWWRRDCQTRCCAKGDEGGGCRMTLFES